MIEDFWKDKYPAGIAADINPDEYPNIQAVLKQSCVLLFFHRQFDPKPTYLYLIVEVNGDIQIQLRRTIFAANELTVEQTRFHFECLQRIS